MIVLEQPAQQDLRKGTKFNLSHSLSLNYQFRKQIVQNDISDSEFGPPLPDIESTKSETEPNDEDEWIVKPQSL